MGRKLMRVPMDFNYPVDKIWDGYSPSLDTLKSIKEIVDQVPEILNYQRNICEECDKIFNDCKEEARYCIWHNENLKKLWYYEPPKGDGYQLWKTTSEGSPASPVFLTLEELCEWCADNMTIFADIKVSKEEWKLILEHNYVCCKQGNLMII